MKEEAEKRMERIRACSHATDPLEKAYSIAELFGGSTCSCSSELKEIAALLAPLVDAARVPVGITIDFTGATPDDSVELSDARAAVRDFESRREAKRIAAAAFTAGWLQGEAAMCGDPETGQDRVAAEARYLTKIDDEVPEAFRVDETLPDRVIVSDEHRNVQSNDVDLFKHEGPKLWAEVCRENEVEHRAEGNLRAAEYHRGAAEAYERCDAGRSGLMADCAACGKRVAVLYGVLETHLKYQGGGSVVTCEGAP